MNKLNLNTIYNDASDVPELGDDFFQKATLFDGNKVLRPGRPPLENPKQAVTIRFDAEVIAYFKSTGKGWQTRMNSALNEWIKEHVKA